MDCDRQSMREWGDDLERRIILAKTRVPVPAALRQPGARMKPSGKKPHGFYFSWPPQANPKNRGWRRALRSFQVHRSWRAWATHKSESTGGCPHCYATEATQAGAEAPGFVHMHCHYCEKSYLG